MGQASQRSPAPSARITPAAVRAIVVRIPEGFIAIELLAQRLGLRVAALRHHLEQPDAQVRFSPQGNLVYDPDRLALPELLLRRLDRQPAFPTPAELKRPPIAEQLAAREETLLGSQAWRTVVERVAQRGYLLYTELAATTAEADMVQGLLDQKLLAQVDSVVYDPLRLGPQSAAQLGHDLRLEPLRQSLRGWLAGLPGQTARREEFFTQAGRPQDAQALLARSADFMPFTVTLPNGPGATVWVRLATVAPAVAEDAAWNRLSAEFNSRWEACRPLCGEALRPGARDGQTAHVQVVVRSYLLPAAAKRLQLSQPTVREAAHRGQLASFTDPVGQLRLTAASVEAARQQPAVWESLAADEPLTVRDMALVSGLSSAAIRAHLEAAGLSQAEPRWGQVRGQWGLPASWRAFGHLWAERQEAALAESRAEKQREADRRTTLADEAKAAERRQREALRQKLLTVFPAWSETARAGQTLTLHLGPTNSGKTYQALQRLAEAGSGWYLAPLRLLAYEVFETLNRNGTRCNLLTGEEAISVPGAQITASTIEMFSPSRQGEACTVIDEAHMLSDEARGWAWTRAIMEAQAPELHVIAAPPAGRLVQRLAEAAGIPVETVRHPRLTPLAVAPHPWALATLPPRTILVAFSRAMVLGLKTELERNFHRTVSIIYGDLPPEVRHNQAARFAAGETEICVATDAVGMGLNLPADHVCFFEVEKFDGQRRRSLTSNELRQIGGRAGRYGLSAGGLVGALDGDDLAAVRRGFQGEALTLEFARVAPSPEALALLPGTLAQKLTQWMELRSIPDNWRQLLRPVDVGDAVELAALLTPRDVAALGEATALLLVRAPTDENTRTYWLQCAQAIVRQRPMPLPPNAPAAVRNGRDLQAAETGIRAADVYLWLSQRREFATFGLDADAVRAARAALSREVDLALQRRIDTARRCRQCGRPLRLQHRFSLCDRCHQNQRYDRDASRH